MGGDSNPRYLAVNTLSRRAQSTTLPPILSPRLAVALKTNAPDFAERNSAAKTPGSKRDIGWPVESEETNEGLLRRAVPLGMPKV